MKYPVILNERAQQQLEAACQWWSKNRSLEQATRWFVGFVDALYSLDSNPERCGLALENNLFPYEVRELHYGLSRKPTHRVLFTIRPDIVYVFAIRHVAQKPMTPDDL